MARKIGSAGGIATWSICAFLLSGCSAEDGGPAEAPYEQVGHPAADAGVEASPPPRDAGDADPAVYPALKADGVDVRQYDDKGGNHVHSKYLLIDSEYQDGSTAKARKLVWTGSHNYTEPALRFNDETLLRVDDADVFEAYQKNFTTLRAQSK